MIGERGKSRHRRFFSVTSSILLLISAMFIGISFKIPDVSAGSVSHTVGDLDVKILTDYGRILEPLSVNGQYHTVRDGIGFGFIGLVIDQDNYDHTPGAENIAEGYDSYPYIGIDDFQWIETINMRIDDGVTQKSTATFENTGVGTLDPNDIRVNQMAWTVADKDWAILQWRLTNLKAVPLTGVCIGLEVPISKAGATGAGGLGGDNGDDIDGYDAGNSVYWAADDDGTTLGFGSAIASDPITHFYSEDYHVDYNSEYIDFFENETWLYERLHAPNTTVGVIPGNRTSTVGWNGITIDTGESRSFTLVISINTSFNNMITAIKDAQYYYNSNTGFILTEFSDSSSGTPAIEIFNSGREETDLVATGYGLSVDGGTSVLTGNWNNNPLPMYEYSVFTPDPGQTIGPEGGTIGLYLDDGVGGSDLIDEVAFGQEGVAPDPLSSESASRYYDYQAASYTDHWVRNATAGTTWGAQNSVVPPSPLPHVILNEVMFNPANPELGFVELMYTAGSSIDLQGYRIVCDTEYTISNSIILDTANRYYQVTYNDNPAFFGQMDSTGDNVYLYDDFGKLLDMVGWESPHLMSMSVSRVPDGGGTFQGYDDISSQTAGWIFDTPLQVNITEISDGESGIPQLEVYNPRYPPINFSLGGFTFESESAGVLTGSWSIPFVDSGEHAVFDAGVPLGFQGDVITLRQHGMIIEVISYGVKGMVPDPLPGESVQRYWNGTTYTDLWERNHTIFGPNFGLLNILSPDNLSSPLVLNEVLFNPSAQGNYFLEIYNLDSSPFDISGYKLVCNTEYIIPDGTTVIEEDFFYLFYQDGSGFFDNISPSADNIYLYNPQGGLADMVGWNSPHTMDRSISRSPEGDGTRDGFDDISSTAAGWRFDQNPSISLIQLDPDSWKFGTKGENVTYYLSIYNKYSQDLLIDISNSTGPWGWEVLTLNLSGGTLNDSNGNGLFDIYIGAGARPRFSVVVKIPSDSSPGDNETTNLKAQWSLNPFFTDNATLITMVSLFEPVTFPPDSFVIPMDDKQNDVLQAFGFVHAVLSNGSTIYRIIEPPDIIIETNMHPGNEVFAGGPILIMPSESTIVGAVHLNFPSVTLDTTIDSFTYDKVDVITKPTTILLIYGVYGHTQDVLSNMGIPFTMVTTTDVESNPDMLFDFDLIVDDCPGWSGAVPAAVAANMQVVADQGGEVIFTDIALRDLDTVFPGHIPITPNIDGTRPCSVYRIPEFPGQYHGPSTLDIYTMSGGQIMMQPTDPEVRIMVDCDNYNGEYRVLAAYFYYGSGSVFRGVVEGFGYHPGDQPPNASILASIFFGNKFVHLPPQPIIPDLTPPELYIKTNSDDIFLNWTQPTTKGLSHYLIYRSTSQTEFDFSDVWVNTSLHNDNGIIPLRTTLNDTGAASENAPREYYYVIRSVFESGEISHTSRTVGKWTKTFPMGISTFSLPLEPLMDLRVGNCLIDMNATYIKWINPTTHVWMKHGENVVNDTLLKVGEGYEVKFQNVTNYTFTGMPGAMILFDDDPQFPGFHYADEAKSLNVIVDPGGGVNLMWQEPASMMADDWYEVYYSHTRDGFFGRKNIDYHPACPALAYGTTTVLITGLGASDPGVRLYFMVVPFNSVGIRGSSTYSIGMWTEEYLIGYDTIGIPLKLTDSYTTDWYCDNIPETVGINYYINNAQRWGWHSKQMAEGAFDTLLEMTEGYQISTSNPTKFTFIGI